MRLESVATVYFKIDYAINSHSEIRSWLEVIKRPGEMCLRAGWIIRLKGTQTTNRWCRSALAPAIRCRTHRCITYGIRRIRQAYTNHAIRVQHTGVLRTTRTHGINNTRIHWATWCCGIQDTRVIWASGGCGVEYTRVHWTTCHHRIQHTGILRATWRHGIYQTRVSTGPTTATRVASTIDTGLYTVTTYALKIALALNT